MFPYPSTLPLDVALELESPAPDIQSLLDHYDLTVREFKQIKAQPTFLKQLDAMRVEIKENGLAFKLKCRVLAEDFLPDVRSMVKSADVSPAVKATLVANTVKWAGYEPSAATGQTGESNKISVVINLGDGQKPVLIEAEVLQEPETLVIGSND